jgi:molecular chaperone GrpE
MSKSKNEHPENSPEDNSNNENASNPDADGKESVEAELMVGMSVEEYDQLQNELEQAREEAQKNLDGWQRALADYNNLRRRTEMERSQMKMEALGNVVRPFLDVLDDLELAVKNRPSDSDNGWGEGIELVYRKLLSRLENQGISQFEALGQEFDPRFHEAIMQEQSEEYESGVVMDVLKPGYKAGDRVIRPAIVRVAA